MYSRIRQLFKMDQPIVRRGTGVADNTIQLHGNSAENRYPRVFAKAAELVTQGAALNGSLRVLSFGCSTGQEAFVLATKYFPADQDVQIIGLDINPNAIREARANNPAPGRVRFFDSNDYELARQGPYDLVFAMSVLCVWPETASVDDISPFMTFDQFEMHVKNLDAHIRPGGYLVIYNASFCFSDSSIAVNYEPILVEDQRESGFVKKFDRHNRSLDGHSVYPHVIFRKVR